MSGQVLPASVADFAYDRKWIMRSTLFLAVAVVWVMVLITFLLPFDPIVAAVMGFVLGAFFLIVGVSPFLTRHTIDTDEIILRQGWHFKISIPIENIKAINLIDEAPKDRSLLISQTRGVLNITSSKRDLISLKLRRPQRFASMFWRKGEEIVFDVADREGFRSTLENTLAATRANPARSSENRP
ncbi:MAG TPA: hypothetical protein VGK23_09910 [Methanomassiliicoccales archaeon]|jgi:hypothetical protein